MSTITVKIANGKSVTVNSGLYINGEWVKGNGAPLESINPATEEKIATVETASQDDIELAVKAARECFEGPWGLNSVANERATLLNKFADVIEANTEELALLEVADAGKPISWAKADIGDAVACFRYYAGCADKIHGKTIEIDDKNRQVFVRKEPIGVVAQIVPWNYPIVMLSWKLAPALATGCSIVFKPAENTPLSTLKLAELFSTVGYPKGVWNILNGTGLAVGQPLAEHMDIDKIAFTGSTAVGKKIAVAAAQSNLKKVTLELGGKSANIVFESADLEDAASWAAFGIFENMGQSCTAGSRILVQESVYDKFVKIFTKKAQQHKVGDVFETDTMSGPQISKVQFDRILDYLTIGKEEGATVATGGDRHGSKGYYIQPTVFTDVTQDMRIANEEIFGPVVAVIKFKTEEEAIKIANATQYGLAAGVHSNDARQLARVTRQLKAGTVWQCTFVTLQNAAPFGGYRQSGWGRELGTDGLDAYLQTKAVHQYYGEPLEWPIKL